MKANLKKSLSPKSRSGSLLISAAIHATVYGGLILAFGLSRAAKEPLSDYIDLGYETFDEPPEPAQEVRRVMSSPKPEVPAEVKAVPDNSPKEIQDEKGDVAGTQTTQPQAANVGSDSNGTAASTPYYKIKPKYPKAALVSGVEGWVLLEVDIREDGAVENIRVIDGEQRNMFQSEARRAVSQWKYRPFIDGSGRPVRKVDHQVRVDFRLTEASTSGS